MNLRHSERDLRWERIALAVKNLPERPLRQIAEDFDVSLWLVKRACQEHNLTRSRGAWKWGDMKIRETSWLHVGDVVMCLKEGNRQAEIIGLVYHEDLTVSYRCRPISEFRKGAVRYIHERTLRRVYVRIKTTERKLPDERFLQWTFGLSNSSPARSRLLASPGTTPKS